VKQSLCLEFPHASACLETITVTDRLRLIIQRLRHNATIAVTFVNLSLFSAILRILVRMSAVHVALGVMAEKHDIRLKNGTDRVVGDTGICQHMQVYPRIPGCIRRQTPVRQDKTPDTVENDRQTLNLSA
jgi:hypothetical protein